MAVYEITFRLEKTGTYQERYKSLNDFLNGFTPHITNEDSETTSTLKIKLDSKYTTKQLANTIISKANLINGDKVELIRFENGIIIEAGNINQKTYERSSILEKYLKS